MTTQWNSFYAKLNEADENAMSELFDQYSGQLVKLASENIHPTLKKRFDGEDIVQSVFRTFFRRHQEGKFQIDRAQQLWSLLVTITLCKTRSHTRRHLAEKRNARSEIKSGDFEFIDRNASREDAVALWEEINAVLAGLPPKASEILVARLQGNSKTEIAKELGVSRQTIYRILKLIEERLSERFDQFSGDEPINQNFS